MRHTAICAPLLLAACFASSSQAGDSTLSLSFAAALPGSQVVYSDATSHFHVLVTNTSPVPQRVWEEWNSWGYFAVSFEFSDKSGAMWVAKKRPIAFTRNVPSLQTIAPGEAYVVDVYFGNENGWEGFPVKAGESHTVQMRAVFEITDTKESNERSVWVGRIESERVEVTFIR